MFNVNQTHMLVEKINVLIIHTLLWEIVTDRSVHYLEQRNYLINVTPDEDNARQGNKRAEIRIQVFKELCHRQKVGSLERVPCLEERCNYRDLGFVVLVN